MKIKFVALLFLVMLLGISYQLIVSSQLLAPGYGQLIFLVFLLVIFWKLKFQGFNIPLRVLLISFLISTFWFVIISKKPDLSHAKYYLANFSMDLYGKESRKFLQILNASFPKDYPTKVYKLNYPISSNLEAEKVLKEKKRAKVVLWGDDQYIFLRFSAPYKLNLNNYLLTKELSSGLKLITEIPALRIYRHPELETIQFISRFLSALHSPTEKSFRLAGGVSQVWHSSIHLAYLRFKLANFLFLQMLENSDAWQEGAYKCILKEYQRAAFYLRKAEHPDLAVAINNNQEILRYLKIIFKDKKINRRMFQRLKALRGVAKLKSPLSSPMQSIKVVNTNLKVLKGLYGKGKKRKK